MGGGYSRARHAAPAGVSAPRASVDSAAGADSVFAQIHLRHPGGILGDGNLVGHNETALAPHQPVADNGIKLHDTHFHRLTAADDATVHHSASELYRLPIHRHIGR